MSADQANTIDFNPAKAIEKIDSWLDGAVKLLPNFAVAIVVFIIFYILGKLAKKIVKNRLQKRERDNLGEILGGFLSSVIIILGFFIAATIIMPSLQIGDLVAGLGVSSVAIGFAFKDILQNWLAGLLILLRQPFEIGDQIVVNSYEGTVDKIETRATIIKTYNGQKAVVPNSDIYTNAVLVKTAYESRRTQYDIGIGYGDNMEEACDIIKDILKSIPGIEQTPKPEAFVWDLAASWVTIRARWWTDTKRGDVVKNKSDVLLKVKKAFDDARIDMPYDTQVQLVHDQTEDRDGKPGTQREGWPAPKDAEIKPRWEKELKLKNSESGSETKKAADPKVTEKQSN